jgi:hypothetical protein
MRGGDETRMGWDGIETYCSAGTFRDDGDSMDGRV